MLNKFFKYHFPIILYLIIIFIFSSIPGDHLPDLTFTVSDKILHGFAYFIAFFLFYFSLSHTREGSLFNRYTILFSLLFTTLYGMLDEIHQLFVPNRDADVFDFLADFFGALIGLIFIILLTKIKTKKVIL